MRKYKITKSILLLACVLVIFTNCRKAQDPVDENSEAIISPPNPLFHTCVPLKSYDIILTKPEPYEVTLSVLSYRTCQARIEYYLRGTAIVKSIDLSMIANQPVEVCIAGLMPSETYGYFYLYKTPTSERYIKSPEYTFKTAKTGNIPFIFAIQADSHLDMNTDTTVYRQTLMNIAADDPDFMVDLGDTFMNDKYGKDFSMALYNYIAQRYFFGSVCHSLPLFFVQGNHDGEAGMYYDGTLQGWSAWSNGLRKKYFPMPSPDNYFTGNPHPDILCGNLQNYYAWEWSDALFVVLDPFWYTPVNGQKEPWDRTLGSEQYNWLRKVLASSTAKFKFIFIHNLVGGFDTDGKARGGAEAAGYYEWGGRNMENEDVFFFRRPDWQMPVHQLLVKYGVNVVFHGHDHFFAYQQLDGIIYQELPQPSVNENFQPGQAAGYGYKQGLILGGTGYLRVTVDNNSAKIEYIRTRTMAAQLNKEVAYSYTLQ